MKGEPPGIVRIRSAETPDAVQNLQIRAAMRLSGGRLEVRDREEVTPIPQPPGARSDEQAGAEVS